MIGQIGEEKMKQHIPAIALLFIAMLACATPGASEPPIVFPTHDPNAIQTYIVETAALASTQTAAALPLSTSTPAAPVLQPTPVTPRRLAFTSNRNGSYEIYTMNFDGSNQARPATLNLQSRKPIELQVSPDGTRIAYYFSSMLTPALNPNYEIYVMNVDGTNPSRLTDHPADDYAPAWSPDGTRIVFESKRDDPQYASCAVCNREIYIMNSDGTNQTRLTSNEARDSAPTWSPDGARVYFLSDRNTGVGGALESYTMNADGTDAHLCADTECLDGVWSPDHTKIAFVSIKDDEDGQWPYNSEIYVMNADGTNPIRLTNNPAADEAPAWSPDGQSIIFVSYRDEPNVKNCGENCNSEIYVMNADGSNQVRLTNDPAGDWFPVWLPVGVVIP